MYEDELHEFYSIPLVVPVPKYNYEIYDIYGDNSEAKKILFWTIE